MTDEIPKIREKLRSKHFATKYPRHERADANLYEVPSSDHDTLKYVPPAEGHVFCKTTPEPQSGYVNAYEINLEDVLPEFNQLLIYRIFRGLYGRPDILSAYVSQSEGAGVPKDWGYSFSVGPDLIGEVRSAFMARVYLSFWLPEIPDPLNQEKLDRAKAECLNDLHKAVKENAHLWFEKAELAYPSGTRAFVNVPAEKYKGGELLLSKARQFDRKRPKRTLEWGAAWPLESVGHLYLAAATMFFVSLESFVNLLYRLLLREEFQARTYERLTVRSDLDLRIVAMHVFCRGFASQTIQPDSELWKRLIQLKDFRNDVVHGNITEEHEIHCMSDDGFLFFYSPATDFRGHDRQKRVPQNLTRFQPNIGEATVETTKQIVDELRSAIIAAMDAETRGWCDAWLWQPVIPPYGSEAP